MAGMGLSLGGCAIVGYGAHVLFPPKVDPRYEPAKVPMLVLVENRQNPAMALGESDMLTSYIIDDLKANEVCPVVDPQKFRDLRDQKEKAIDKMTISEIGKATEAQQVLYVDVRKSNIGAITGVPTHGRIEIAVHVVDVKTGQTLFPKSSAEPYPMSFETSLTKVDGTDDPALLRQALAAGAGTSVGRLFHTYYPQGR
jgi:hypothetical protein